MKKVKLYLVIFTFIMGTLFILGGKVNAASLEKTAINIYAMDGYDKAVYSDLSIPSNLLQTYKIVVKGATGTPTFSSADKDIITVDSDGNITPARHTCIHIGEGTTQDCTYGTTYVNVKVDGETLKLKVTLVDYTKYYCENLAKKWVNENLTSDLTDYQKFEKIVNYVADNFIYDAHYSTYYSMLLKGGGDCFASTDAIVTLCEMVGIKAHWKNAINENPGSNHRNAVAIINGEYYVGEAGFSEYKTPRTRTIRKLDQGYYTQYDYTNSGINAMQYEGYDTSITIPSKLNGENVTKIATYFTIYSYPNLKSITLPNTVKTIDKYAFSGNYGLEKINIPDSVETIGDAPFAASRVQGKNVTVGTKYSIKNNALLGDNGKTFIQAFYGNTSTEYTVPAGVTKINPKAFYITGIERVNLPSSLTTITSGAFEFSGIKSITIPSTVKTIESRAFAGATSLNTVIIENGATSIGDEAFASDSKINILRIPASVTNIGKDIFKGITDTSGITIYGVAGSAAESYAKDNNINFIAGTKYAITQNMEKRDTGVFTYTGKEIKPKIEIIFNGKALKEGTDYTITFKGDTIKANNDGIYYTVKGIGNYSGEFENKYYINKADWDFEFTVPDVEFGTEVKPQITNGLKYTTVWYKPIDDTSGWWTGGVPKELGEYQYKVTIEGDENHFQTIKYATNKITGTPLKSISVTGGNEVEVGKTLQLSLTFNPTNASVDRTVKWTSSDTSIATVAYSTGLVRGVKEGTVTITAKAANMTANYTITVKPKTVSNDVYISNIEIKPKVDDTPKTMTYTSVFTGTQKQFVCTITPTNATNKKVTWSSAHSSIATVDQNGMVKGIKNGYAKITVTPDDNPQKSYYLWIAVIDNRLTNVTLNRTEAKLEAGQTTKFLATPVFQYPEFATEEDKKVTYKSENTKVATITSTGTIKAVSAGNTRVSAIVKGSTYYCYVTVTDIVKKDITKIKATVSTADVVYTGKAITRGITIKDGSKTLVKGTDYTVSYKNNVNVGTATITITGIGDYSGTVTKTFKIISATKDISKITVSVATSDVVYTGSKITRGITIKDGSKTLVKGTDYTVSYKNNVNIGTATITITGIGDYSGTVTKTFKIISATKDISKITVSVATSDVVYTGSKITRGITIKDGSKTLVKGTDYTVSYKNNVNIGTATITITGIGNYSGTVTKTFKIISATKDISKVTVSVATSDVVYTGSKITRGITIKDGSKTLVKGTDYTVSYKNNVNIGTATITITGTGDYSGTVTRTFKIVAKK